MTTPPPIPTQSPMTDDGKLVTRTWLNWFTFLGQKFGFYQSVQVGGIAVPTESALNFLAPLTAVDNRSNGSTDIALPVTIQTIVARSFGVIYQNTGLTVRRVYIYLQAPGSSAGTATVYSDGNSPPTTQIAVTSVISALTLPASGCLSFEVLPGNYYMINRDVSISIQLAVEVQ